MAPKRRKSAHKTNDEARHLQRVAELGCIACSLSGFGYVPAVAHHIREGQGAGQRAGHYLTLPLCPDHHTDSPTHSIHRAPRQFEALFGSELELLDLTLARLNA